MSTRKPPSSVHAGSDPAGYPSSPMLRNHPGAARQHASRHEAACQETESPVRSARQQRIHSPPRDAALRRQSDGLPSPRRHSLSMRKPTTEKARSSTTLPARRPGSFTSPSRSSATLVNEVMTRLARRSDQSWSMVIQMYALLDSSRAVSVPDDESRSPDHGTAACSTHHGSCR